MNYHDHWSGVYQRKAVTDVSWYQDRPALSLALIGETHANHDDRLIDVGAGASTLAYWLLQDGYTDLTLLDISDEALQVVRDRLAQHAPHVTYLHGDITQVALPTAAYQVWHDRAVFHFLTTPAQRQAYIQTLRRSLTPNGHVVMATFALDGPTQCSGLDVMRYDADHLYAELGEGFKLVSSQHETHLTPWGSEQKFIYIHCERFNS